MGMIARTDTFLDICFIHIIASCWDTYLPWVIPTMTFGIMNLIFPFCMLLYLLFKNNKTGHLLYQPYLEDTCFAAFIRENMLLATVLDSFCINNSFYFFGKPLVFGKLMGFISTPSSAILARCLPRQGLLPQQGTCTNSSADSSGGRGGLMGWYSAGNSS